MTTPPTQPSDAHPAPWEVKPMVGNNAGYIVDANGMTVAHAWGSSMAEKDATAALICNAVNGAERVRARCAERVVGNAWWDAGGVLSGEAAKVVNVIAAERAAILRALNGDTDE